VPWPFRAAFVAAIFQEFKFPLEQVENDM
jgi:hypothetical protein